MSENTTVNTNAVITDATATTDTTKTLNIPNKLWSVKHARAIIFIAYMAVVVVVMCFHEPWFDEAQSWLIARDSSFADLLTLRPHYEGHPPLWTLLLSIPAKTGVPYEIGLKGVQLLCTALLGGWLIFRAPFSKLAVFLLPFTYFLCFQYGVTSRPYALLCAALFMVAHYWKQSDSKPSDTWKLALSLVLLCAISAYGIALSAGFALAWIWRAAKSAGIKKAFAEIFSNINRLVSWIILALVGIASIICIWPAANAFASRETFDGNSPLTQFLSFIFVMPSESMFTQFAGDVSLRRLTLSVPSAIICVIISILIWAFAVRITYRRGMLVSLILPYLTFAVVATQYFTLHHAGIVFAFFVAQLWMCIARKSLESKDMPTIIFRLFKVVNKNTNKAENSNSRSASKSVGNKVIAGIITVVLLSPSLIWNAYSCVNDIRFDYSGSRALAQFIKQNHAENMRFVTSWLHQDEKTDKQGNVIVPEFEDIHQYSWQLITANPYFSKNLIDCSYKNSSFITNEQPSQEQASNEMDACKAKKEPKFFVTESDKPWYYFVYLNYNIDHYTERTIAKTKSSWKAGASEGRIIVYERKK
ncbi:ABC transporter ATP-binding protein [Gardnerella leopoldii]|uniref:ABC transporter ATP-binding protein n=1 Tax=Gardnerella leopoldii TaxID=2792978 RepID=UPI0015729312|nr:ABC transporter ATP-binding protein [Gardnerella vaginalis]